MKASAQIILYVLVHTLLVSDALAAARPEPSSTTAASTHKPSTQVLNPTHAGYLPLTPGDPNGGEMYYIYFEAKEPDDDDADTRPIVLWLNGGPGCSGLFGMLYINGPSFVQPDLTLKDNPHSWNRKYGMLFIDQPVGTGFSLAGAPMMLRLAYDMLMAAGNHPIPDDELPLAADLYQTLNNFYKHHSHFCRRPLYISGESYAGKYLPSLAHYIIQADAMAHGEVDKLQRTRDLPDDVEEPVFVLGGMAIGNGFTDAVTQTLVQAEVAFSMGMIDTHQREVAEKMQHEVVDLVRSGKWRKARKLGDEINKYITDCSGSASLEDIRRNEAYDAQDLASQFLNIREVKANMNAREDTQFSACSPEVDEIMGHDVMKSVADLVPDIIAFSNVLLYQGQFDAECGVASNEAWVNRMAWPGHLGHKYAERALWERGDEVLGYRKSHMKLTNVIVRNAGHMLPHDRPDVAQEMIEAWVDSTLKDQAGMRGFTSR